VVSPPAQVALGSRLWIALDPCRQPANLRRTITIAAVVGTVLTLINQGDVLANGDATGVTALKIVMNYIVPFIVSNLGVLSGARRAVN
jgi:hypothetical protein